MSRKVKNTSIQKEILMKARNLIFCTEVTFTGKHSNVCVLQQKLFPWHLKRKKERKEKGQKGRKEGSKEGGKEGREEGKRQCMLLASGGIHKVSGAEHLLS